VRTLFFKFGLIGFFLLSGCVANTAQIVLQSIIFDPDTLTVNAGNSVQLNPHFNPTVFNSIDVQWSSSNKNAATVSSTGLLYGVQKGTATITIKDKYSAKLGKCLIIVQ